MKNFTEADALVRSLTPGLDALATFLATKPVQHKQLSMCSTNAHSTQPRIEGTSVEETGACVKPRASWELG
jgi:hypothetical protein